MSIVIDKSKCTGCLSCTNVCPGSLIKKGDDGKAYMKYPKDCWGCCSCIKECRFGALSLYLGADIGGMGSRMSVTGDSHFMNWRIEKKDAADEVIIIDKTQSNQY